MALLSVWVIVLLRLTGSISLIGATLAPTVAALCVAAFMESRDGPHNPWILAVRWRVDLCPIFLAIAVPVYCAKESL